MKSRTLLSFVGLAALAVIPAFGQQDQDKDKDKDKGASTRTVTGCLQKGDDADEYKLVGDDGSTWEVHEKDVKLSPHVGHTVTVTGKVWHAKMHEAKEKTKDAANPGANEHGHLRVTNISMVSDTCKK